jgi:hypothetical protein
MATPDEKVFRVQRLTAVSDPEKVMSDLRELGVSDAELDVEDFNHHVSEVKELTDKIADIFDSKDYTAMVALDALENVLRSGVAVTMGDSAGELLNKHLHEFHRQAAMIHIVEALASMVGRSKGEGKKTGVEDLLAELSQATDKEQP